ncbi:MAG: hypothetical protein H7840_17570 [Alphaproteobacteria bacterium]
MVTDVEIGMIYEQQDMSHSRWVVNEIAPIRGIVHVTLRRIDAPAEVKLLAATVVSDEENIVLLPGQRGVWRLGDGRTRSAGKQLCERSSPLLSHGTE